MAASRTKLGAHSLALGSEKEWEREVGDCSGGEKKRRRCSSDLNRQGRRTREEGAGRDELGAWCTGDTKKTMTRPG